MTPDRTPPAAMLDRPAKLRAFFARYVARRGGAQDPRTEQAFAAVPREPFAGPAPWHVLPLGPWSTRSSQPAYLQAPDDDSAFLYQDVLITLDPARGINIGEPSLHAHCLDALARLGGARQTEPGRAALGGPATAVRHRGRFGGDGCWLSTAAPEAAS